MTFYMGLDLSLTGAGIVVISSRDKPFSLDGTWDTGVVEHADVVGVALAQDASEKERVERMIYIAKSIIQTARRFTSFGEVSVGIENYAFSTVRNAKGRSFQSSSQTGLAELHGVVKSQLLMAMGLSPVLYSVKTARMVVFGDGNFQKSEVRPTLNSWGFNFKKADDADAFVIAECHRRKMRGWHDERKKSRKRG